MTGLPRGAARNPTGDWACDGDKHCVCWWDRSEPCCQCHHRYTLPPRVRPFDPTEQAP